MSSLINKTFSVPSIGSFRLDSRYFFVLILLVILSLEIGVIKGEVAIVSQLQDQARPLPAHASTARVNFADYDWAIDRINKAKTYQPGGALPKNPFGAPPR